MFLSQLGLLQTGWKRLRLSCPTQNPHSLTCKVRCWMRWILKAAPWACGSLWWQAEQAKPQGRWSFSQALVRHKALVLTQQILTEGRSEITNTMINLLSKTESHPCLWSSHACLQIKSKMAERGTSPVLGPLVFMAVNE